MVLQPEVEAALGKHHRLQANPTLPAFTQKTQ